MIGLNIGLGVGLGYNKPLTGGKAVVSPPEPEEDAWLWGDGTTVLWGDGTTVLIEQDVQHQKKE